MKDRTVMDRKVELTGRGRGLGQRRTQGRCCGAADAELLDAYSRALIKRRGALFVAHAAVASKYGRMTFATRQIFA